MFTNHDHERRSRQELRCAARSPLNEEPDLASTSRRLNTGRSDALDQALLHVSTRRFQNVVQVLYENLCTT